MVCQRNQISYYLTSASCGGVNGWSQTFSNNIEFAKWALDAHHIPTKFANYVHGKEVAQEIEAKRSQPSDEHKSRLGSVLNELMRKFFDSSIMIFLVTDIFLSVHRRKMWREVSKGTGSCWLHTKEEVERPNCTERGKSAVF